MNKKLIKHLFYFVSNTYVSTTLDFLFKGFFLTLIYFAIFGTTTILCDYKKSPWIHVFAITVSYIMLCSFKPIIMKLCIIIDGRKEAKKSNILPKTILIITILIYFALVLIGDCMGFAPKIR